jgi:hypothetical protein
MRADLSAVLCFGTGRDAALGAYVPLFRVALVDPRHVLDPSVSTADLAKTILHEATHARLHQRRAFKASSVRSRVEALCDRTERAFELRLGALERRNRCADAPVSGTE